MKIKLILTSILATLNWLGDYGAGTMLPNVNVLVNCLAVQGAGAQAPIDSIRSVKIDNTGNAYPIYVKFPDTTDTIVAPANTIVWEPVVTNQPIANIYLIGAQDAGLGLCCVILRIIRAQDTDLGPFKIHMEFGMDTN